VQAVDAASAAWWPTCWKPCTTPGHRPGRHPGRRARALVVIDTSEDRNQPLVLVNPEIVWASDERQVNDEGCLSVPGIYDGVERASTHQGAALDEKANRARSRPTACWPSASSTRWTTCWARCSSNTCRP
jgi:hypothetical protein